MTIKPERIETDAHLSDEEITEIAFGLISRTLPKARWTHKAHFAAAIWILKSPDHDALRDMPGIIWRYNEAVGGQNTDNDGYHETITQASLMAADSIIKNMADTFPDTSTAACLKSIMTSRFANPDWLFEYWSKDLIFSIMARRVWVAPNIKPLDF